MNAGNCSNGRRRVTQKTISSGDGIIAAISDVRTDSIMAADRPPGGQRLEAGGARVKPIAEAVARAIVGIGVGLGFSAAAAGQNTAEPGEDPPADVPIEEILVTEQQRDRYGTNESGLSKLTESLHDTPQSIATLSGEMLEDRGITSLNDALRTVPGITLGAGEFSWQGNNPTIRGFNARDDMYLDGVRDFGSYARDPFNLESVEVLLGPSSILFGRGSTGGAINQVSKRPTMDSRTNLSVNVGSDETYRGTADISRPIALLGDGAAFRLNLLAHNGDVTDRDGAHAQRFGIAPSLALGLGSATELTLSYMKQNADDRPDYGLPWLNGRPAPVPRENFYGFTSDYLKTDADIGTFALDHRVNDSIGLEARVRYARYTRESRITEPLITDQAATDLSEISVYRYVFFGDSEEKMLMGQVDATLDLSTGSLTHSIVTGVEYGSEASEPVFAFGIDVPGTSLLQPNWHEPFFASSSDPRVIADTTGDTLALYALDTIEVGDDWRVTLGARWDRFDTSYEAERFAGPPTPFNAGDVAGFESFEQTDKESSYRMALTYVLSPLINVYFAASTSFNPSAQSLSLLSTGRGLGTSNALLDPEENRSLEIGVKAELRDGLLSLSGAIFEIDKTNARIADPSNPGFNTLGGEHRVRGVSIDLNGMIAERLYLSSGYTYLDGEVVKAAAGSVAGAPLAHAPEHSVSLWLDYLLSDRFDVGFGARYVSEQLAQNTGTGKAVPGYSAFDAMAQYRMSDKLTLKLNLTNLGNEYYFDQLHPWHVVPAPGRTATFAVNFTR